MIPLQCLCQVSMLMNERKPVVSRESNHEPVHQARKETMIERGHPLSADSGRASSEIPDLLQEFRGKFGG